MKARRRTSGREHNLLTMLLLGKHHIDVIVAKTRWRLLTGMTTNLARAVIIVIPSMESKL